MSWDESLRYNYSLDENSTVLDVGGFEGDFAHGIYSKYSSNVFVFEPVQQFYDILKNKFRNTNKIRIYNYGLGVKDETISLRVNGSATSVLDKTADNNHNVEIKDILPIISEFDKIDLMKLNIEGAEYDLLDYIIKNELQKKLMNIQVQFHLNVTDCQNRRNKIREELSRTHHLTYDYEFTWENWEINQ